MRGKAAAFAAMALAVMTGPAAAQRPSSAGARGLPRSVDPGTTLPRTFDGGMPTLPVRSRDPALISTDWFPHEIGETPLEAWTRKNMQVQQPAQPEAVAIALSVRAAALSASCSTANPLRCRERDALVGAAAGLRTGLASSPDCGEAAKAFAPYYQDAKPPNAVARRFDLACLGSLEVRDGGTGPETPAAMPAILAAAVGDPAHGMLAAVGILERAGVPFCASLIRPDRTVVTARHCYDKNQDGFTQGSVTVRPASGHAGPWPVSGVRSTPAQDTGAAADDWIVLGVGPGADFSAPATTMAAMPLAGAVTVVGHYAHFEDIGYAKAALPGWRRGLRFPRQGLCQSIRLVNGCLQIACQTVRGFSGAPVFLPSAGADGRPQVVGFVSQDSTVEARCPPALAGVTLAVSAGTIQ